MKAKLQTTGQPAVRGSEGVHGDAGGGGKSEFDSSSDADDGSDVRGEDAEVRESRSADVARQMSMVDDTDEWERAG